MALVSVNTPNGPIMMEESLAPKSMGALPASMAGLAAPASAPTPAPAPAPARTEAESKAISMYGGGGVSRGAAMGAPPVESPMAAPASSTYQPASMPSEATGVPDMGGARPEPERPATWAQQVIAAGPQRSYVAPREAGYVNQARTIQSDMAATDPETIARMREAGNAQVTAAEKTAQAQAAIADAQTAQAQQVAENAAEQVRIKQAKAQEQAQIVDDAKRFADQKREETPEIESYWKRSTTGTRIATALSIAFGAVGQALAGGENQSINLLRSAIDDDVAAQKEAIRQAEGTADRADNRYQQYLDYYGDPSLADQAVRLEGLDVAAREAEARVAAMQGEAAKAQGMQAVADIRAAKAQEQAQFEGNLGRMTVQQGWDPGRRGGVSVESTGALLKRAKEAGELEALYEGRDPNAKIDRSLVVTLPDGSTGFAKDAAAATATQTVIDTSDAIQRNIARMREIRNTPGVKANPALRAEFEALASNTTSKYATMLGMGALSGSDKDMAEAAVAAGTMGAFSLDSSANAAFDAGIGIANSTIRQQSKNLFSSSDPNNLERYVAPERGKESAF